MSRTFPESDWRAFKIIQARVQDRVCRAALVEASRLIRDDGRSAHDRFRDLCRLISSEEESFDRDLTDHRRSTAFQMLLLMDRRHLLSEEDLASLSAETRQSILEVRRLL